MKGKLLKTVLMLLVPLTIVFNGCAACDVFEEVMGFEIPDISLIEDYTPTKQLNIASYANNAPSYVVLQSGIVDVHDVVKKKENAEISGLRVACKVNGIYCFFTTEKNPFNVRLLSYDGTKYEELLSTKGIPGDFSFHGTTDTICALSYTTEKDYCIVLMPLADVKEYSTFKCEDKNELIRAINQGGNGEFIIETTLTTTTTVGEESVTERINKMYLYDMKTDETSTKINFDENGKIYVGAGQDLAIVCAQPENSWYIVRDGAGYKKMEFDKEVNDEMQKAKYLRIVGDYFVIGNPCTKESKVFSFASSLYESGEIVEAVKKVASGIGGTMFNVSYNKYSKTFIFERGTEGERKVVPIFGDGADGAVVPEILKTISVAKECKREQGIVQVQTFIPESHENIFGCVYYDKNGSKIYCLFTYNFESNRIDYVGVSGEGASMITLPGANGIEVVLYD